MTHATLVIVLLLIIFLQSRELTTMGSNAPKKNTTFDAGQFGSLRFDFTAFGGQTGIIPDPSDEKLEKFSQSYMELLERYGVGEGVDQNDPDAVAKAIEQNKDHSFVEQQGEMVDLIAELVDHSPSAEQMAKLPFRVRQRFLTWVQRELVNPEA